MKKTTFPDGKKWKKPLSSAVTISSVNLSEGYTFHLLLLLQLHGSFLKEKEDADDNKNTHEKSVEIDSGSPTVAHRSPKITTRNGGKKPKWIFTSWGDNVMLIKGNAPSCMLRIAPLIQNLKKKSVLCCFTSLVLWFFYICTMQLSNAFNFYFLLNHAQNSFLWTGTFFPEIKIKFRLWDGCVLPPKSEGPPWDPHKCNPNALGKRKMIQDTTDHTHVMWPVTFKLQAHVVSCSDMRQEIQF